MLPLPTQRTTSPTVTPVVETYPLKQVWIAFGSTPKFHPDFETAFPATIPTLVIYTDGTMIQYRNKTFQTKKLGKTEVCDLLTRIGQLGFSQLQTNGIDYEDDPIYAGLPAGATRAGDAYEYLIVNGDPPKSLWVYEPIQAYAIQTVKEIMNVFRKYAPAGMHSYTPDRVGLFVQAGRPYKGLEKLKAIPWPVNTPLKGENAQGALYLEGKPAVQVFRIFQKPYTTLVFTEQGQEYTVVSRPLLPHERRINYGIDSGQAKVIELALGCK